MQKRIIVTRMADPVQLCSVSDIPSGTAKGFRLDSGDVPVFLFIVNMDDRFFAYENRCPHAGTPLDWQPDQFLDEDGRLIQCSTHGALFRIEDGLCVYGPCINQSLRPVEIEIRRNVLVFYPSS